MSGSSPARHFEIFAEIRRLDRAFVALEGSLGSYCMDTRQDPSQICSLSRIHSSLTPISCSDEDLLLLISVSFVYIPVMIA